MVEAEKLEICVTELTATVKTLMKCVEALNERVKNLEQRPAPRRRTVMGNKHDR